MKIKNSFKLEIVRLHWSKDDGSDDPKDLFVYGEVYLRIGDKVLSNVQTGSWNLSTTALYLMRTLNENYQPGDFGCQLLPCCGDIFVPTDAENFVVMVGCPNGIDWQINHLSDGSIQYISDTGEEGQVNKEEYLKIVLTFVSKVEAFFNNSEKKILPSDAEERKGYKVFRNEWRLLKNICF